MVVPPASAAAAAKVALAMQRAGYAGGVATGLRRGRQLAARRNVSDSDRKVMAAWFARHGPTASNGGTSFRNYRAFVAAVKRKDPRLQSAKAAWRGAKAWLLWGGNPAYRWVTGRAPPRGTALAPAAAARALGLGPRLRGGRRLCARGVAAAKTRYSVYPSAYANGYAVQVCQGKKPDARGRIFASRGYRGSRKSRAAPAAGLNQWFREKWVDVCTGRPCGRSPTSEGRRRAYPYCRPTVRVSRRTPVTAWEMTHQQLQAMCRRKRKRPAQRMPRATSRARRPSGSGSMRRATRRSKT